jgi:peptide/nickel transport system permease protein
MISSNSIKDQSGIFEATSSVSQWRLIWQGFRRHRLGMMGLITLLLILVAVIFVPVFFPDPSSSGVNIDPAFWNAPMGALDQAEGHIFILGTNRIGQDNLILLLKASQLSLLVAFVPAIFALIVGFTLGVIAGYFGGWLDTFLMQITDFLLAIPLLPACVILVRFLEMTPLFMQIHVEWLSILLTLVTVFTFLGWMGVCRLVRALVLSLRSQNYVEAAQALGASTPRIMFRHLLPNTSTALLVAGTLAVGDFAVLETILAYFGLGIHDQLDASINSLGTLLAANSDMIWYLTDFNPFKDIRGYLILFPILFLLIIVIAINFIGDALRDVLDPRLHA